MPANDPKVQRWQAARAFVQRPEFQQLSPQAQQVFLAIAQASDPSAVAVPEAAWATAYSDAKAHGFDPFDWRSLAYLGATAGAGALAGGLMAGGAAGAGGGGAGAGSAAAESGVLPSTATVGSVGSLAPAVAPAANLAAGTTIAPVVGGIAGGVGAASSIWDKINKLSPIIQAGTGLLGAKMASDASTEAAEIQAAETDKALKLQQALYEQQRADLGPYRSIGYGSLANLAGLTNQPIPPKPTDVSMPDLFGTNNGRPIPPPNTFVASPTSPSVVGGPGVQLTSGGPVSAPTVMLRAPDGSTKAVPADQADHYVQLGAVRV